MTKILTCTAIIGNTWSYDVCRICISYFNKVEDLSQPEGREREFIVGGCHG